ncbi:MAG: Exodeoxyribonuclease 7 large subunit [Alphaproteobacteria bacterium MarineAlpha5_Bin5]|nr:MAG: Exodeoxyribonuclease 7 large subunit [Alphaproteobacteria bacterium MarineAlpha5_Bin5]|tara:strand:+ start:3700 stop:5034 length:1335 start_codon:yes stop_codon:yes gene_type:complete
MNHSTNIPEYKVTQFNRAFKQIIQNNFDYVRIKGEISEIKEATKGQIYLTIKDEESILSGVVWEQKKRSLQLSPEIGMEVILIGKITTWSKFRTTYQIDIDKIEIAGEGALLKLIEDRKKKLKTKGLFNIENKKSIPFLPDKIGVITSPTGSVIYDIINRISDRFSVPIDLWPVSVQGTDAAMSIIEAIKGFNNMNFKEKPSVIIIARGGGSTEDLMAFNDEKLAISVYNSNIPIISAIGHETDTTIIDFVSDLRASTPTAAAEKAVPLKSELAQMTYNADQRLNFIINNQIKSYKFNFENLIKLLKAPNLIINNFNQKLEFIFHNLERTIQKENEQIQQNFINTTQLLKIPKNLIYLRKNMIINLNKNLNVLLNEKIAFKNEKFYKLIRILNANSITTNLKKGYSILTKKNKLIKSAKLLQKSDVLKAQLSDNNIEVEIKKIN